MILKILLELLLISLLIYMIYVKFFKKPREPKKRDDERFKKSGDSVMISCAKCGTFAESLDSIAVDGKFYCSKECAGVR